LERGSSADQIKSNYRNLSKKYHIDAQLQRSVLPGKCADVDEVREEWDKVRGGGRSEGWAEGCPVPLLTTHLPLVADKTIL